MPTTESLKLVSPSGGMLYGVVHLPSEPGPRPTVVVCHGFKGFMEWGFFPYVAELLCDRGFVVVRFNFSGAGMRPGDDLVTDTTAFRNNTYSQELADLLTVLEAIGGAAGGSAANPKCLGLFGHSRGGAITLLAAAHPNWRRRIRALVTWSSVGHLDRFSDSDKARWRRDGELPVVNARTGQRLALGLGLLEGLEGQRDNLDLAAAARRRIAPWLIVHGDDDETVPVAEAHGLCEASAEPRRLLVVPGVNHTFGAQHPFVGPNPHLIQGLNATQVWLRRYLMEDPDQGDGGDGS